MAVGQLARVAGSVRAASARAPRSSLPSRAGGFSTCWSMAAFRKKASTIGAGPLIVIETEVLGRAQVEARVELLGVVDGADETPEFPTLP